MANAWIEHVRQYAKKHNLTYSNALKEPKCKASYKGKKPVVGSGGPLGLEDFDAFEDEESEEEESKEDNDVDNDRDMEQRNRQQMIRRIIDRRREGYLSSIEVQRVLQDIAYIFQRFRQLFQRPENNVLTILDRDQILEPFARIQVLMERPNPMAIGGYPALRNILRRMIEEQQQRLFQRVRLNTMTQQHHSIPRRNKFNPDNKTHRSL